MKPIKPVIVPPRPIDDDDDYGYDEFKPVVPPKIIVDPFDPDIELPPTVIDDPDP